METRKHIIKLPENKVAENILVKTENGQIIVNYDLKNIFNPKDGDFLVDMLGNVFICKICDVINPYHGCYCGEYEDYTICVTVSSNWVAKEGCRYATESEKQDRYATESEKQEFLEKLKEAGYTWNAEKKCLEEYVWKPKRDEEYFFIGIDLKIYSNHYYDTYIDYLLIPIGNYFQTKEQAEKKAKELREVLKKK